MKTIEFSKIFFINLIKNSWTKILGSCLILGTITIFILGFAISGSSTLIASGSTTVLPLLEEAGSQYKDGKQLSVSPGGSTVGIQNVKAPRKIVDFGDASRYPKAAEIGNNFSDWKSFSTITLSYDVVIMIVNGDNDLTLTPQQLHDIYSGKITNWNQINDPSIQNSSLKNMPISVIARAAGSGTRDAFFQALDNYGTSQIKDSQTDFTTAATSGKIKSYMSTSNGGVISQVNNIKGGIGFVSLGYISQLKNTHPINIKTSNTIYNFANTSKNNLDSLKQTIYTQSIATSNPSNVDSKTYLFWHPMNIVFDTNNRKIKSIETFIIWMFQWEEQQYQNDTFGYIPPLKKTSWTWQQYWNLLATPDRLKGTSQNIQDPWWNHTFDLTTWLGK